MTILDFDKARQGCPDPRLSGTLERELERQAQESVRAERINTLREVEAMAVKQQDRVTDSAVHGALDVLVLRLDAMLREAERGA